MQLFYAYEVKGNLAYLDAEESLHCVKSLRKKVGDQISMVDGFGSLFEGNLVEANKRSCVASISSTIEGYGKRQIKLHIAIAPTKNNSRFEWFLEKATEIGIDRITPIICKRSERKVFKTDRFRKIMIGAMKQSLKAYLPKLDEPTGFNNFVSQQFQDEPLRLIAHCSDSERTHLKHAYSRNQDTIILIGPEGDFTLDEIQLARANGFSEISLGDSRLRTETAGIVACTIISMSQD
ncbi:MAG: 16S rRNA (uracil(1498)-N(3))-methyltransferase [Bacteroidota bacterium]